MATYQNEEAQRKEIKQVTAEVGSSSLGSKSFRATLMAIATVSLAFIALSCFVGTHQTTSPVSVTDLSTKTKTKSLDDLKLFKQDMDKLDYESEDHDVDGTNKFKEYQKRYGSRYPQKAVLMNNYLLSTVVDTGKDAFLPFKYLKGKVLSQKYKTLDHGLDEDGIEVKGEKPYYSIDINFWQGIYKSHYNADKTLLESKILVGAFKGLDGEGNAIFLDGPYCEAEDGPTYGKLEVICGHSFKVTHIEQSSMCSMKVIVSHPMQCNDPVKTINEPK